MNRISENSFAIEADDAAEPIFTGRAYKKVPEDGDEPCVFAYTKTCDFLCENGYCACLEGIWVEDVATRASARRKKPLARCRHCGQFHANLKEVDVGGGVTELWCSICRKEDAKECPKCGKFKAKYGFVDVEGSDSPWCGDCCAEHAVKCPRCNGYVAAVSAMEPVVTKGADGRAVEQLWCRRCAEQAAVACSSCGKPTDKRHAGLLDGRSMLCPLCAAEKRLSRCHVCGGLTRNVPGRRGDVVCDTCRFARQGSSIRRYHDFALPLLFWDKGNAHALTDSGNLYLGFELEAGGASETSRSEASREVLALDPEEERFHQEYDSTIPNYGFELISAPHTLVGHLEYDWEKVLKIMVRRGLRSHDLDCRCGLHVHVSKSFLTGPDMAKIDLFVLKNKTFWEKVARRASNRHTQYLSKPVRQHGRSEESAGRYAAVNFCNKSTVEFRIFRGTLNYASLIGTLAIVDGICRWVKTRNSVQILKNDGETDRFYAWLKESGPQYAPAVAYIDKRNALSTEGEI